MNITPKGKQKEVLALPSTGHTVVLGTAGSGKTTIALLRAYHLAALPGNKKVLLVTFNGALVEYIKGISDAIPQNLTVENYHKFARGYLHSRGKMPPRNGILNSDSKAYYISLAKKSLQEQYPTESTLARSDDFFVDEITFIEKFGFTNLDTYNQAERIGRASANIKRENRKWVFAVYKKYIELRKTAGHEYDWDDLALYVYLELKNDPNPRRYTHIIVDEGQDFSPMMIKSLVSATACNGSFTFFGDVAQQIYGSRLSWRDSGINTDKIWRFNINYRNPSSITAFAKDITRSEYWVKDEDMVDATAQIAEGPKPILIKFSERSNEKKWIVDRAIALSKTSSVVIICRNRSDIDMFLCEFEKEGCTATEIDKDTAGYADAKKVYLSTFHSAKGLEFDNVFIPFLEEERLPDPDALARAASEKEVYADEIKLLYVAVTRSKYGLFMTYSKTLSMLFPKDSSGYGCYNEEDLK